jgi:undecaprenyl-diphosphatase
MVIPGGTLNHLSRDLGLDDPTDAVEAVKKGEAIDMDVATIDGRVFLNTASFGAYADLVDAREKLESRIGKWPALAIALIRVLRRGEPVDVEIDGEKRKIWMIFIGNCKYNPSGFAPAWRKRLDDGQLDIRIVDASSRGGVTRLIASLFTGRLGRSRIYEQRLATRLEVKSLQGPLRLAHDGETFDGREEFVVEKLANPLTIYTRVS